MTKASEKEKIRQRINRKFLREQAAYIEREYSPGGDKYRNIQTGLLEDIRAAGQTNDPALILSIEKDILENEKQHYANSPSMISSLDTAIQEMTAAEKMLDKVRDPETYRATNDDHSLSKRRSGKVPRDDARTAFSSHLTRLLNMDKSRLTETEKKTIKARRSNLRKAEKAYTALQHKALGMAPPGQSRERGLER